MLLLVTLLFICLCLLIFGLYATFHIHISLLNPKSTPRETPKLNYSNMSSPGFEPATSKVPSCRPNRSAMVTRSRSALDQTSAYTRDDSSSLRVETDAGPAHPKGVNDNLADHVAALIAENKLLWDRLTALESEITTLKQTSDHRASLTQIEAPLTEKSAKSTRTKRKKVKQTPISANVRASAGCSTLLKTPPHPNIEQTDEAVTTPAAPEVSTSQPEPQSGDWQRPRQEKSKTMQLRETTVVFYGVTESEGDHTAQKQLDILKVQEIIPHALNDGEELHIKQLVRIGQQPSAPTSRPRPIKVFFESAEEAQLFLSRSPRAMKAFPDQKLGFRREYSVKEQQEWRTRRKELQNEIERRKQEGEVGLTLRGLHIIKTTHSFLWTKSITCRPQPTSIRK